MLFDSFNFVCTYQFPDFELTEFYTPNFYRFLLFLWNKNWGSLASRITRKSKTIGVNLSGGFCRTEETRWCRSKTRLLEYTIVMLSILLLSSYFWTFPVVILVLWDTKFCRWATDLETKTLLQCTHEIMIKIAAARSNHQYIEMSNYMYHLNIV